MYSRSLSGIRIILSLEEVLRSHHESKIAEEAGNNVSVEVAFNPAFPLVVANQPWFGSGSTIQRSKATSLHQKNEVEQRGVRD